MRIYIFFLVCLISSCAVVSQKNKDSYLEIDFQDFFKNDTISLKVNEYLICKDKILNSDFSTGITDVRIRIFTCKNKGLVKFGNDSIIIGNLTEPITIIATLNGNLNECEVNLENGKYVGLSNKGENILKFYQSKVPFEYD